MTPAQLRAFVAIVRAGSVKQAAAELGLTEQAVSMHVAALRKSLGDQLFSRTRSGLAFTPGGLRLAARAVEILGLQDQTVSEVGAAAGGRRTIRLASSSLFAEHAASGLIDLFTKRAKDLEVELSVHSPDQFATLLASRAVDVAIGPTPLDAEVTENGHTLTTKEFLTYDIEVMAAPTHPFTQRRASPEELAHATWNLGPSAAAGHDAIPEMLVRLGIPDDCQRIFQSDAAAWEETQRGTGLTLAPTFAVRADLHTGRLARVSGTDVNRRNTWSAMTLAHDPTRTASELMRFVGSPKAMQAMLRGSGVPVKNFRPAVYVTLWH
ncbi:LysR family transcriptional regulator [Gordonia rhizosphera]|uniref:Putative LysR family transcriptional regulator n=1 Tax=Gordonia rhizosphera NBRC 16068 TaxID=1108045 RepID=K6WL84_9ACTN|nr:LysR family transcriptional regulator [Gordonia rhizosphera]GAB92892.1 putative LysR family transcriptional regulator [Gordonia rhizosphera NBRC 16068]